MSWFPPVSSTGQLSEAFVNHCDALKQTTPKETQASSSTPYAGAARLSVDTLTLSAEANRALQEQAGQIMHLVPETPVHPDVAAGKTIVENKGTGLIVGSLFDDNGRPIITPSIANSRAEQGAATHGFFYLDAEFLYDAAQEYTSLGENEVFRHRNINDYDFVHNTLDFFTNGNYTSDDVHAVTDQITSVVRELAQQLNNGEKADLSKVQTKLTIGGAEVSISELLEMGKIGRELEENFNSFYGTLSSFNIQDFSKMGIAKSIGNYYGSGKGEIGAMFSDAIDRLYEKGIAQANQTAERTQAWESVSRKTPGYQAAVELERNLADLFSKLDTSSKSSLSKSFSSALSSARSMVQQYCSQYGVSTTHVKLAGATDNISKFFQGWMDRM